MNDEHILDLRALLVAERAAHARTAAQAEKAIEDVREARAEMARIIRDDGLVVTRTRAEAERLRAALEKNVTALERLRANVRALPAAGPMPNLDSAIERSRAALAGAAADGENKP